MRAFERLIWSAVFLSTLIPPISAAPPFRGKHICNETQLLPSYDYVVIGGGIAGLVLGNRLSEDNSTLRDAHCCSSINVLFLIRTGKLTLSTETSVLIIEAGIL
jgi:hypothetical protein